MARIFYEKTEPSDSHVLNGYYFDRTSLKESFGTEFNRHLSALNEIVSKSGDRLEGSIFYTQDNNEYKTTSAEERLAPARRNYWRAVRFKSSILEIGVNACHSALLALSLNRNLIYHGVDINWHTYTPICAEYMMAAFPGRFFFTAGDSREVLPKMVFDARPYNFDVYHVDGGHSAELCRTDLSNCLRLSLGSLSSHLLLDDINAVGIYDVYCEFVARGKLSMESFFSDWEDNNTNLYARMIP